MVSKDIDALLQEFKELKLEVRDLKKENKELKTTIKKVESISATHLELLNHIHSKVSDLSCKADLSAGGSTKTVKANGKSSVKVNINGYIKNKYIENDRFFDEYVSRKKIDELLKDHEIEIKKRKGDLQEKYKANLIYKEFIQTDKEILDKIRELKKIEESAPVQDSSEGEEADEEE